MRYVGLTTIGGNHITTIINVQNIQKSFKKQTVLKDVSLSVTEGTVYALLGANGSGKTTLLKIITGLLKQDAGITSIKNWDANKNARAMQQLFSYSAQASTVDDILTGFENLVLIAKLRHIQNPKQVANDLLTEFKLTDAANKRAAAYSGGMRRRLDLAMSLVGNPEIVFLDEPTTGLDPASRNDLWDSIRKLKKAGKTIFLTTQYLKEADLLADEIGFLRDGEIVETGTPAQMKRLAGPDKLQLSFKTETEQLQAASHLSGFDLQTVNDVTLTVKLPDTVQTVMTILTILQGAEIKPDSFQVTSPTLDDVFMQLTKGA
ncbi:ABC transporter ATP-binding protein [Secundilactobacillus oryzae JCM 18671]|uniref:ABC transporter ATP-binding protein n=1 Tax=Secundilactobacillus oryzae JCM 18671 TaxID=1291743 RepID=A0A081BIH8_9LACO|nr:ATP-binding cassette domain-containing protein [Secundilactobacillus oryzae]GAK47846.1 ABC transporter ATP-binding protein [Secundilactobacillus oryzae JCM 18671]